MQDARVERFKAVIRRCRRLWGSPGLSSVVLLAACLFAASCVQSPQLLHGTRSIEPGRGLLVFSVVIVGEPAEVACKVHGSGLLAGQLGAERVLFGPSRKAGTLPFGVPAVLSAPPGLVTVSVERVGDFWDFAGGRPQASVEVAADRIVYLGTLVIRWEKGASIEIKPAEEGRAERLPHSPAHGPPRWRYGVIRWSVRSEKDRVLVYLKERFDLARFRFTEAEEAWEASSGPSVW